MRITHVATDRGRCVTPVTVTLALYLAFTLVALALHGWDPGWFVWEGARYAQLDPAGKVGYDGQFVIAIAAQGWDAVPHLDNPGYRLQRILLPALLRGLALGSRAALPWLVLAVNAGAVVATTGVLGGWLAAQGLSRWYALTYALYVGTLMAYSRDLTEPLALCLAAAGAGLWLRHRRAPALAAWALAALAKEITLLFPIGAGLALLARRDVKGALPVALSGVPLLVWEGVLWARLGALPLTAGPGMAWLPLQGILSQLTWEPGRLGALVLVGLPALPLAALGVWLLVRHRAWAAGMWLLLHAVFVLLMPPQVYDHLMHAGRNAGGMVLAAVFALPYLSRPLRLLALGFWTSPTLVWLVPILRWAPWRSQL